MDLEKMLERAVGGRKKKSMSQVLSGDDCSPNEFMSFLMLEHLKNAIIVREATKGFRTPLKDLHEPLRQIIAGMTMSMNENNAFFKVMQQRAFGHIIRIVVGIDLPLIKWEDDAINWMNKIREESIEFGHAAEAAHLVLHGADGNQPVDIKWSAGS